MQRGACTYIVTLRGLPLATETMHYHICHTYDSSNLNTVSAVSKVMYVSCLQSKGEPKICISTIGDESNTTVQHYPKSRSYHGVK